MRYDSPNAYITPWNKAERYLEDYTHTHSKEKRYFGIMRKNLLSMAGDRGVTMGGIKLDVKSFGDLIKTTGNLDLDRFIRWFIKSTYGWNKRRIGHPITLTPKIFKALRCCQSGDVDGFRELFPEVDARKRLVAKRHMQNVSSLTRKMEKRI
jgi:hypothetical protein